MIPRIPQAGQRDWAKDLQQILTLLMWSVACLILAVVLITTALILHILEGL